MDDVTENTGATSSVAPDLYAGEGPYKAKASTGVEIDVTELHGFCPVQADGRIGDAPFYFRARGNRWRMLVGVPGSPVHPLVTHEWQMEEPYGEHEFEAGWMEFTEARRLILKAAETYLAHKAAHG